MTKFLDRKERAAIELKAREAAYAAIVNVKEEIRVAHERLCTLQGKREQLYDEVYRTTYAKLRAKAERGE